ncbi:sugar kinase [Microbacterium sp. BK668]|uniref:sugar kinase n=1 Tax=Microbacterium sp. BK668 TaxID=2512118 RepID=UPI00105EE13B|nr:sugar kinase [Microbacterium sp. BK668]TDN91555.1 2-keto-3-deoxygluconate kinase [Microbacterium sp. BK668]
MTVDIVTLGESLGVFAADGTGPLRHGRAVSFRIAGAESNVAIGMRRLGKSATWISVLGRDAIGAAIRRELRAEGVEVLATESPDPTAVMVKTRKTPDINAVHYLRRNSAFARAGRDAFDLTPLRSARCFHFTGISLALGRGPVEALRQAVADARAAGAVVSMDFNVRRSLWVPGETDELLAEFAAEADLVFASADEAAHLVRGDHEEALARALLHLGPSAAVVKLGARGALIATPEGVERAPAVSTTVVDAIGAGDAFAAGFLASWLDHSAPLAALRQANAVAAFAVASESDWENLPSPTDLSVFDDVDDVIR